MTELVAWLLFPAVVVLLGLGCGLLVERASGRRLPGVLLVPVGLALIAVLSDLLTRADATAEATAPVIVLVALAGVGLSLPRLRALRIDPWAAGAALLAFAALLAPVVSSGSATFTGYTILDDSSVHFSLLEQVFERGHSWASATRGLTACAPAFASSTVCCSGPRCSSPARWWVW